MNSFEEKNTGLNIDFLNSTIINIIKAQNSNNTDNNNKNDSDIINEKYLLSKNINNLMSKTLVSKLFNKKFVRIIEYINNYIISGKKLVYKLSNNGQNKINIVMFIYILRNNIISHKHFLNKKLFRIIILMIYKNIISIDNFILLNKIFLNSGINLLIKEEKIIDNNSLFKRSILGFINDLFVALTTIPRKLIKDENHIRLIDQLILLFDNNIFNIPYNLYLSNLDVWMKLLGNKILNVEQNDFYYDKIISFLVKIYKYNFQTLFLFKNIYEKSCISFDYYANSLDFLLSLFKEEQNKRCYNDFKIKNGFYIYNNIPLVLNNIRFKATAFSLIFSFRLTKKNDDKEDTILLNLANDEKGIILRIIITQPKNAIKVIASKIEWEIDFNIEFNKDYLVCLVQEKKSLRKKIHFFINTKKIDKLSPVEYEHNANTLIEIPDFDQRLLLELGKSNFEGIFGDLLIINKKIRVRDMFHLYSIKEDYSDIISTVDYNINFTYKKKKYSEAKLLFFSNLKYQCVLKILAKEISYLLSNRHSVTIKPYGELKYINNNIFNNDDINIKIYNDIYSIDYFLHEHGIEYLIFQLHKIKTLKEDNKIFNFCLYKTLHFLLEYIKLSEDLIFPTKNNKFKVEVKFYNFYLSLIAILSNKKNNLELNEEIRKILLDFDLIFQSKKCFNLQSMNFNILFDTQLFGINNTTYYDTLLDRMIWFLNNNGKDNPLLLFYKILLFDDYFEQNQIETNHKKYMEIITYFITDNQKPKIKKSINECLIQYLTNIKNPKKIYHYLKIIYYEINSLKNIYKENNEFINYIIVNYNKLDKYYSKYCRYNQILCFLLYDIIINKTDEKNAIFGYSPFGFMKNPNYNFIKCIFIQCFKLENKQKFKFIKSSLQYGNEIDILNDLLKVDKLDILSLIDLEFFIPKLDGIIKYYYFLYNEYLTFNNKNILNLLKKSIKLILDLFDKIIIINQNSDNNDENINKPESQQKNINKDFIEKLFTCSCIKLLFILYFNVFEEEELKDLKYLEKYISFSISTVYNPFYFYFLLPFADLNTDIHLNKYYKSEILQLIVSNIILYNNTFKIDFNNTGSNKNVKNDIIFLNSIIILIRIYSIINNNENSVVMIKTEKIIYVYLKFILENNLLYSKYIFNINLFDENVILNEQKSSNNKKEKKKEKKQNIKNEKEYKYLSEITLDIIFYFLAKKKNSELIAMLNNKLNLNKKNSLFYEIDEFFLIESNLNKNENNYNNHAIHFLNTPIMNTTYCNSINANPILFCPFFFIYFYKQKNLLQHSKAEQELTDLINKSLEILFKDTISLVQKYLKSIKKLKSKFTQAVFKIYYIIFDHFLSKYKDNSFHLKESDKIYSYFKKFLNNSKEIIKMEKNNDYKKAIYQLKNIPFIGRNEPASNLHSNSNMRKTSYIPEFNYLLNINEEETNDNLNINKIKNEENEENREKKENNILYKRSRSIDKQIEINILDKEDNTSTSNSNSNNNKNMIKLKIKPSSKYLLEVDNDSNSNTNTNINLNNIDLSSETNSENSFFDNNSLGFNSNYKCNNFNNINNTEEKKRKRKNDFYSNKNFRSTLCFNSHLLYSNKILNQTFDDFKEEENNLRNKITQKNFNIINIQEEIENEKEAEHKYILDKLKDNEVPYFYYREMAKKEEPKSSRIVLNPKREIMKIFGFSFRKYIYNIKKFKKVKYTFKMKKRDKSLEISIPEEENYSLNYPTKLKNFTCNDYYRPFLKPILNYFDTEYFYNAHPFLNESVVNKESNKEEQLGKIKYDKISLIIKKKKSESRFKCENISNKGSIFGALHLHNSLMAFQDKSKYDHRSSKEKLLDQLFYLFSSDINDRLIGRNKSIIIYYNEIKEIILRRYCFTDIAFEIFMKDNRSYFFNFFNKDNRKNFYESLIKKINNINSRITDDSTTNTNSDSNEIININVINDSKVYFDKKDFKNSYIKKTITNFQYLLQVNKCSSRSYNDNSQYLIFPLLYMDLDMKVERDLSKPISLNKKLTDDDYIKFQNNYETMGYHFNNHYASMAYVLFYLMRLFPFTNCQIKLQSGHFDSPSRIFSSLQNLLYVFGISEENRELLPELFHFYECFLNLNYNDFGFIEFDKKQIHHFSTSQKCGIIEFIINLRNLLETKELAPWINNIFGYKQINENYESFNCFPKYSYEQFNNFEKLKEEINEDKNKNIKPEIINDMIKNIKNKIEMLTLGLTPSQLFKSPHPYKENNNTKEKTNENKNKSEFGKTPPKGKEINCGINISLKNFINKENLKNLLYSFNNINNNEAIKIIFVYESCIIIFDYISENDKEQHPQITLDLEEDVLLKMKPYRNSLIEMYENIFLLCRLINRTLLLCSEKKKIYIEWPCIITAIELYSHSKKHIANINTEIHINKIILGDEDGYLSIVEIITEYIDKKKEFKIKSLNNCKKNKAHYSYINGIAYIERLNIIISSCGKGFITINNAYSFDILNIININKHYNILDFKLSKYDLLYIYTTTKTSYDCKYELYCFTLNGIKIKRLNIKECFNFYIINTSVFILYKDGNIQEYNCCNFKEIENHINKEEILDIKKYGEILHSVFYSKFSNFFIIFGQEYKVIQIFNNY